MGKKIYASMFAMFIVALITAGCGGTKTTATNATSNANSTAAPSVSASTGGGQKLVIKLGHQNPDSASQHKGALKFKELVEKNSNGQMEVQVFPSGQIGSEKDLVEANKLGTVQMSIASTAMLANFAPKATVLALPYVIKGTNERERYDSFKKLVKSDAYKEILQEANDAGLYFVSDAVWWYGDRHITTKSKPIKTPADLKGLKIRTPDAKAQTEPFKIMGANVTTMGLSEVYMALQTGTIDAQENPINTIYTSKFQEVQKYLSLTGHMSQNQIPVISLKWWKTLKPDQQKIISDAIIAAGDYQSDIQLKANESQLEDLKKAGMEVVQVDQALFKEATKDVYQSFKDKFSKEFYDKILQAQ